MKTYSIYAIFLGGKLKNISVWTDNPKRLLPLYDWVVCDLDPLYLGKYTSENEFIEEETLIEEYSLTKEQRKKIEKFKKNFCPECGRKSKNGYSYKDQWCDTGCLTKEIVIFYFNYGSLDYVMSYYVPKDWDYKRGELPEKRYEFKKIKSLSPFELIDQENMFSIDYGIGTDLEPIEFSPNKYFEYDY